MWMDQLINPDARLSNPAAAGGDTAFRWVIREATHEVHQRLHLHDRFAAIQNATIDIASYRRLIIRLYGFYLPFETAAEIGHDRSAWLEDDLRSLGVDFKAPAAPALCNGIPCLKTAETRLGALYVVEGSALGGRELGRSLDRLLGPDAINGRRFFLGRGSGTGEAWRRYLSQLSAGSGDPVVRTKIIGAALETFAVFESWLSGWSSATDG